MYQAKRFSQSPRFVLPMCKPRHVSAVSGSPQHQWASEITHTDQLLLPCAASLGTVSTEYQSERFHKQQYELYSFIWIYQIIKRHVYHTDIIILYALSYWLPMYIYTFLFFLSLKINSLLLQSMLLRIATFDLHQAVEKWAQNLKSLCFLCVHSRVQLITCFLKSWADLWRVWWLLAVSPFVEEPVFVAGWWLAAAWSFRLSALCSLFLSFPGVASLLLCFWAGSFSFDDLLDPLKTEKRENQVIKEKKEKKKYARPNTSFKRSQFSLLSVLDI